jgi:hypothetical protein
VDKEAEQDTNGAGNVEGVSDTNGAGNVHEASDDFESEDSSRDTNDSTGKRRRISSSNCHAKITGSSSTSDTTSAAKHLFRNLSPLDVTIRETAIVASLFAMIQSMKSIVDSLEIKLPMQRSNVTRVQLDTSAIKHPITPDERAKLVSIVEWDRIHGLPFNWWSTRLYFDPSRRRVIDLCEEQLRDSTLQIPVVSMEDIDLQCTTTQAKLDKLVLSNNKTVADKNVLIRRLDQQSQKLVKLAEELESAKGTLTKMQVEALADQAKVTFLFCFLFLFL